MNYRKKKSLDILALCLQPSARTQVFSFLSKLMLCQNSYMFGGGQKQGSLSWFGQFSLADKSGFCDVTKGDYFSFRARKFTVCSGKSGLIVPRRLHTQQRLCWSRRVCSIPTAPDTLPKRQGVDSFDLLGQSFCPAGWLMKSSCRRGKNNRTRLLLGETERDNSHASAFLNYELNKPKMFKTPAPARASSATAHSPCGWSRLCGCTVDTEMEQGCECVVKSRSDKSIFVSLWTYNACK